MLLQVRKVQSISKQNTPNINDLILVDMHVSHASINLPSLRRWRIMDRVVDAVMKLTPGEEKASMKGKPR